MVITLVVSTLTIIAQIVFLFVITYDSVSNIYLNNHHYYYFTTKRSPAIALVAYVLTEVIPCISLIYTLRVLFLSFLLSFSNIFIIQPLSQKFRKQPTSTEMKTRKKTSSEESLQKQKEEEERQRQKERGTEGITIQTGPDDPTSEGDSGDVVMHWTSKFPKQWLVDMLANINV